MASTIHLGQRGTMVIPSQIRKALNIEEGSLLILEVHENHLLVRPARAVPVEKYTDERKAQFLLESAVDAADYARARELVQKMGLNPDQIPHEPPE